MVTDGDGWWVEEARNGGRKIRWNIDVGGWIDKVGESLVERVMGRGSHG